MSQIQCLGSKNFQLLKKSLFKDRFLSIIMRLCLLQSNLTYNPVCLSVFLSVCLFVCLYVSQSVSLSVCLSVCLSFWLYVCLSVCLSAFLSVYRSVSQSVCLSVSMSFCLSLCLSVCPSVCLFVCNSSISRFILLMRKGQNRHNIKSVFPTTSELVICPGRPPILLALSLNRHTHDIRQYRTPTLIIQQMNFSHTPIFNIRDINDRSISQTAKFSSMPFFGLSIDQIFRF